MTGTKPAIAISPLSGIQYVVVWVAGTGGDPSYWKCYSKITPSDSFTFRGNVTTASSTTYGGLEVSPDPTGRLYFAVHDGSTVTFYESHNGGETWATV